MYNQNEIYHSFWYVVAWQIIHYGMSHLHMFKWQIKVCDKKIHFSGKEFTKRLTLKIT